MRSLQICLTSASSSFNDDDEDVDAVNAKDSSTTQRFTNMSTSYITYFCIAVLGFACTVFVLRSTNTQRTHGRVLWYHWAFFVTIPCLLYLPDYIQNHIFTPLGIALIATIYPVNESLKAVCSLGFAADDTWLQYWVAQVILFYSALGWAYYQPLADTEILYKAQFFYTLWLVLPYTDGSALIFDGITSFCLGPIVRGVPRALDGAFGIWIRILINTIHLVAAWVICLELNSELIPFAVVIISTFYPLLASLASLATTDKSDTSFWLVYWSFFGFFSLVLIITEAYSFVDIQPFYLVFMLIMMYLMLPLFRGSEHVFRSILVPMYGLDEMLMIHDSHKVKMAVMHRLPQARKKQVLRMIATSFFEAQEVCDEDEWLRSGDAYDEKLAFKQGYHSIPERFSEI